MNWNLIIYIVAIIIISIASGCKFVDDDKKRYYRGDFNFASFFLALGMFIIAGLFIFKYNIL